MKKPRRIGLVLVASLMLAGCKNCNDNHDTPAKIVETIDAAPIEVAIDGGTLEGDLRAERFVFAAAVYHFAAPPPNADAAAKKILEEGGFAVVDVTPKEPPPTLIAVVLHPKLSEFAPPTADTLKYRGRLLTDEEKVRVQKPAAVTAVLFSGPGKDALKSYRTALRALVALEKAAPGVVWDDDARNAFGRAALASQLDDWTGDVPRADRHVSIDAYRDGELLRLVTMGMSRFALPDVVVNQVSSHDSKSMGTLVNVVCQTLVERSVLLRPNAIDVSVATLANNAARGSYQKDLQSGTKGSGTLTIAPGKNQEGDPENRLLELVFPGPAAQLQERQTKTLADILGASDSLVHTKHTPEILAASARGRAKAIALKPRFSTGAPQLEHLMVKAPFKTSSGGNEWMWVEVTKWVGSTIQGILENDPFDVPGLKAGARVEVEESSIFDYIYRRADGTTEGNETGPLLDQAGE